MIWTTSHAIGAKRSCTPEAEQELIRIGRLEGLEPLNLPQLMATALVRAVLPELCIGSGSSLSYERYAEQFGQLQLSM